MKQSYEILLDIKLPEGLEETIDKPVQESVLSVKDLEKELLVLRLAFGKLKATASDAFAPLAAVFARGASNIIWWATRVMKVFGQVISGLFGITGASEVTEKTVKRVGKTINRSLAGFDQLNRLQKKSKSGYVTVENKKPVNTEISPEAQKIVDKINELLAPLREIDDFPLRWAFARLEESLGSFLGVAGGVLEQLWFQHLAPFIKWVAEKLLPTALLTISEIISFFSVLLGEVGEGVNQMLTDIRPLTDFLGEVVLGIIENVGTFFSNMRKSLEEDGSALKELFIAVGQVIRQLWEVAAPVVRQLYESFCENFQGIGESVFSAIQTVIRVITGALQVISGLLSGDWSQVWNGMKAICKNVINAIIGLLNGLIRSMVSSLNGIIGLINKINVKIPDWVPGWGGRELGFNMKTVKAPQIPYLAKGAVLPANQPFLAMVGDQKHGTNVEAPLATIQEAVAMVMAEQVEAMMAGFQALLQENRQLRRTVENIEVGDTVIGQAANRYNRRQAVIQGGFV